MTRSFQFPVRQLTQAELNLCQRKFGNRGECTACALRSPEDGAPTVAAWLLG